MMRGYAVKRGLWKSTKKFLIFAVRIPPDNG